MPERTKRERSILWPVVLCGLSALAPACGESEACTDARDTAQAIRDAAAADGIDSRGICGLSDEEITALVDDAPAVPPAEKANRARQYHDACAQYREVAGNCNDLGEDGDVG
jgi:hypothetical protein